MRSFILAAALALSVTAFPAASVHEVSVADALVARTPQFGPFKGRGGSGDDDDDEVPDWVATLPKSSPKFSPKSVPRPAGSPPPKNVVPTPKSSLPPPRQAPPPKGRPDSDDENDEEYEPVPKFSTGPKSVPWPRPQGGPGSAPWASLPKGDRPFPKGAPPAGPPRPFGPPKAQQPKPKSSLPPPAKEPPFPDAEDDDNKVKAANRVRSEPNPWMQ